MAIAVSPPTRGWTLPDLAHVGILLTVSPPTRGWTPAHGSRAGMPGRGQIEYTVSPPTRGWTRWARCSSRASPPTGDLIARVPPWFPRPRGDGPVTCSGRAQCRYRWVSPPTRGWTLMHPLTHDGIVERFPRPRGDGPRPTTQNGIGMRPWVSPPTRGWTHTVHPCANASTTVVSPPTRGWTFVGSRISSLCPMVSPPTRGWTRQRSGVRSDNRFPRPRGDGPRWLTTPARGPERVSPPTRGWTGLLAAAPVHRRQHGFPRPRGDGPRQRLAGSCGIVGGFPAHAGMDPSPLRYSCASLPQVGFPAHAGMDPHVVPKVFARDRGFPRPRGDGPSSIDLLSGECSSGFPRPRGDGPQRDPVAIG